MFLGKEQSLLLISCFGLSFAHQGGNHDGAKAPGTTSLAAGGTPAGGAPSGGAPAGGAPAGGAPAGGAYPSAPPPAPPATPAAPVMDSPPVIPPVDTAAKPSIDSLAGAQPTGASPTSPPVYAPVAPGDFKKDMDALLEKYFGDDCSKVPATAPSPLETVTPAQVDDYPSGGMIPLSAATAASTPSAEAPPLPSTDSLLVSPPADIPPAPSPQSTDVLSGASVMHNYVASLTALTFVILFS